nr:hypothetical protein [Tanacetum cinerariifolium]
TWPVRTPRHVASKLAANTLLLTRQIAFCSQLTNTFIAAIAFPYNDEKTLEALNQRVIEQNMQLRVWHSHMDLPSNPIHDCVGSIYGAGMCVRGYGSRVWFKGVGVVVQRDVERKDEKEESATEVFDTIKNTSPKVGESCARRVNFLTSSCEPDVVIIDFRLELVQIGHLGKIDGKADEGFFVGYSLNSKAFRVFNSRKRIIEENLHIRFSESTPNVVGTKASDNAGQARNETKPVKDYILLPLWTADPPFSQDLKSSNDDGSKPSSDDRKKFDLNMPALEDVSTFDFLSDDEDDGAVADMNNLDTIINVSPIPTTKIHKYHPLDQVIGDLQSATQTRNMSKNLEEHGFGEPKKVIHALKDPRWIEAMQEELLQFKLQEVPQPSGPTEFVADEAVHKKLGYRLVRAATTASSLEAEQDNSNITKTQSKATPNEPTSQGTNLGGGPRCQETMRDTISQTRFKTVSKQSNDSLLARGNTLQSDEDSLKLDELMALCTNLQNRVKGIVFQEPGKSTTTTISSQQSHDKGYKLKDLKLKEFDSIQEMFDIAFKRVNTFKDFRTKLVKGKEKRAGEELVQ